GLSLGCQSVTKGLGTAKHMRVADVALSSSTKCRCKCMCEKRKAQQPALSIPFHVLIIQFCARAGVHYFEYEHAYSTTGVLDIDKKWNFDSLKSRKQRMQAWDIL
ncbi:hypothetical protein HAX54_033947, partial [Datura stramonium]|nr:hypothetical protein [Datura stramonium]